MFDLREIEIRTSSEVGLQLFLDLVSRNVLVNTLKKIYLKSNHSKVVWNSKCFKTILKQELPLSS